MLGHRIFQIYLIIFQQKKVGLIWVVGSFLDAPILMKTKGYPRSNPGRQSTNGRPGARLLPWLSSTEAERHWCHGRRLEGAQAHPIGHQTLIQFFLRDLGYKRNLFCTLIAVKPGHKRRLMGRRLGRQLATVRSSSGEAPASRSSPTSSSWPPLASRPVQWLQLAMNSSNLVAARVRRVSCFAGKNPHHVMRYL
jgi:hypothetical protein